MRRVRGNEVEHRSTGSLVFGLLLLSSMLRVVFGDFELGVAVMFMFLGGWLLFFGVVRPKVVLREKDLLIRNVLGDSVVRYEEIRSVGFTGRHALATWLEIDLGHDMRVGVLPGMPSPWEPLWQVKLAGEISRRVNDG